MIKSNYHTHTNYCDGKNTAKEMVEAAINLGFDSLGFSVHSPMNFENDYECSPENLNEYIDTINQLKVQYSEQIDIYNGIELDEDHIDLDLSKFDYIIAAKHQFHINNNDYYIDYSSEYLKNMVDKEYSGDWMAMAKDYYSQYSKYIIKQKPDIVAHFDLIEKYNDNNELFDSNSSDYKKIVELYLDQICLNCPDVIFEINSGAMYRCGNKYPYPSPYIMRQLKKHNIKICLSSDAHCVDALDFKFDWLVEYCKEFGYNELYVINKGKFEPISI